MDLLFFLARGSLHTASNDLDLGRKRLRATVMTASQFRKPKNATDDQWVVSILERNKYKLKRLRTAMAGKMINGGGNL